VNSDGENLQGGGGPVISWVATVGWDDSASSINIAIKDAAVAAVEAAGFLVEVGDKKTLFRGAIDL